jgi:hypothetical protein
MQNLFLVILSDERSEESKDPYSQPIPDPAVAHSFARFWRESGNSETLTIH